MDCVKNIILLYIIVLLVALRFILIINLSFDLFIFNIILDEWLVISLKFSVSLDISFEDIILWFKVQHCRNQDHNETIKKFLFLKIFKLRLESLP